MKIYNTCIALLMLWMTTVVQAAHDGIGVGIIVGEPTGLSLKNWVSEKRAYDAGAAWSFSENESFQLHADYLIHDFTLVKDDPADMRISLYYGIGARVKMKDDDDNNGRNDEDALVGIRFPLGVSYLFVKNPVELFLEFVPVFDFVPETDFDLNAAVGVRYYFN